MVASSAMRSENGRIAVGSLRWPVLALWLLVGLLTALPGLSIRSLQYDEVLEIRQARLPVARQLASYAGGTHEVDSPPLYHVLLHPVLSLFGTSPFTIRSVAWLAGGALVPIVFVLLSSVFPSRLADLATLGFAVCAWRMDLARMGRPHSLFLAIAVIGLLAFLPAATRRSWVASAMYCLALVAAVQASYWGILVVIPSHVLATVLAGRKFPYWRRAVTAQVIAGATSLYYVLPLLIAYTKHSEGDPRLPRVFAAPLFARCLALFGVGSLDKLDLESLPFVLAITAVVSIVVLRGALAWWQTGEGFAQWLGVCVGLWTVFLFVAHFAAASLATWPMERKFALLLVPLLIAFAFGVQSMRSTRWGYAVMGSWIAVSGAFGILSFRFDPLRDSTAVSAVLSAQPRPLIVYSHRGIWFEFLADQAGAGDGVSFRRLHHGEERTVDWAAVGADARGANLCIGLVREGDYVVSRLATLTSGAPPRDVDGKMKSAMESAGKQLTALGWRPTVAGYFPGRVSFQVSCFAPPPRLQ